MYIVFEGIDNSGKSTQIKQVVNYLKQCNIEVQHIYEPQALDNDEMYDLDEFQKSLLFAEDRLHYEKIIHTHVSCVSRHLFSDRSYYSSLAYQGGICSKEWIEQINRYIPKPDLIIFFDIDPHTVSDRYKRPYTFKELTKQRKIYANYHYIFHEKENVHSIDATESQDIIFLQILKILYCEHIITDINYQNIVDKIDLSDTEKQRFGLP